MACAEGTLARTGPKAFTPVEKLFEGADLYGARDESPALITEPLQFALRPCVKVKLETGQQLICEREHLLCQQLDRTVAADKSLRHSVLTREGSAAVVSVRRVGPLRVVMLHAEPAQPYETNGILSYQE